MSDCIEFQGCKDRGGYGVKNAKGKNWQAHRLVWTEHYGTIPKGMVIRHMCNNPACINIDHLNIGTMADNIKDRDNAGRTAKGNKAGRAKLTEEDVLDILKKEMSATEYAKKYNVTGNHIQRLWRKTCWKHLKE